MRYLALATDYDGTLATDGRVNAATAAALDRYRVSGRRVILVTGRELADLMRACPQLDWFSRVVAENGALLYDPATQRERALAEPPSEALVALLRARGVRPLSVGRVIVATREPHEVQVLEAIRELGLEYEVIFNKGAVMVLPSGVNKATGLAAAVEELGLSARDVVAVGDAENDHAFLAAAGCGVAVANAVPALKARADLVTVREQGAGVVELIDRLSERRPRAYRCPAGGAGHRSWRHSRTADRPAPARSARRLARQRPAGMMRGGHWWPVRRPASNIAQFATVKRLYYVIGTPAGPPAVRPLGGGVSASAAVVGMPSFPSQIGWSRAPK